jgi:hypothetical protein
VPQLLIAPNIATYNGAKYLTRGAAWVRVMRNGTPSSAIRVTTEKAVLNTGRLASAIENTRASYSRPRKLVERTMQPPRGPWR